MGAHDRHVEVGHPGEAKDRLTERVVHQRVETVAAQPLGGDPPDLPDEVGIGADRLAAPPELLPERLVVDLTGHVQPPAIDAEAEPVLRDRHQELADLGVRVLSLGSAGRPHHALYPSSVAGVPGGG